MILSFWWVEFRTVYANYTCELIKGGGLENILSNIDMPIIRTGALVHENLIKQARYCLQVCLCALFLKLKDAKDKSRSTLSSLEWLEQSKNQNEMCSYWYLIVTLQRDILLYVRSLRESNYKLLIYAMKNLMKWVFSFHCDNYTRWATVHLFDLMTLHSTCPDVYAQFLKGNISFQKSNRRFSKMALDQVHEQNNEKIKGGSGATHLLNRADESGLERWETCTPEIARTIESLEENIEAKTTENLDKLNHEDRSAFQRNFGADAKKVYDGFDVNPFEEINLLNISNTSIPCDEEIFIKVAS